MKLTIDNLDGKGAVDYSSAVVTNQPVRIERQLNEPCIFNCTLAVSALNLSAQSLVVPTRNGRLIVADDSGIVLFTGYVAAEPAQELVGWALNGAAYQLVVSAISDEVLLDQQMLAQLGAGYSATAGTLMANLVTRTGLSGIATALTAATTIVGRFLPDPGKSWSQNAGTLASMARNAYRVVDSVLSLAPVGTTVHSLSETGGTLEISALTATMTKVLANDITVCGQDEPCAYVTEFFAGDGTTVLFDLTEDPYFPSSSKEKPLTDLFQEPAIDTQLWQLTDPAAHVSLTSAGLTCTGGNGIDGGTNLTAANQLELGGALVLEADGVLFGTTTQGILNGLYNGTTSVANCIAGFHVEMVSGSTVIAPLVNGADAGATFSPAAGHLYTLRLRTYSNEAQRVLQSYYSIDDTGLQRYGGTFTTTGLSLVLEIQDMTDGVVGVPTILYSGAVENAPPVGSFVLLNSSSLQCSIASVTVTQEGPSWVVDTPSGGTPAVRRLGTTAQGADCEIERTGKLRFYATSVPAAGDLIAVSYRTTQRAVARKASAASIATESAGGLLPGTSAWAGTVTSPAARSSADCENAASAMLDLATSRAAAWAGKYIGWNMEAQGDIWPGDVLSVASASANLNANLVVRTVQIDLSCTEPGLVKYTISFANDWANDLAIKTSITVPTDTWLPQQPETVLPLANLNSLSVTALSGSAIAISAGATPPTGGGFEVRRRDWAFGPGTNSDLVLRSPVANFSIPRAAAIERYYIRMYDASTPPNYSRFSSAVFVNVPL